jgi:hypothetical protein
MKAKRGEGGVPPVACEPSEDKRVGGGIVMRGNSASNWLCACAHRRQPSAEWALVTRHEASVVHQGVRYEQPNPRQGGATGRVITSLRRAQVSSAEMPGRTWERGERAEKYGAW